MRPEYQPRKTREAVAAMTRDGYTPPEIADMLRLTRQTVHYHLQRIELDQLRKAQK